MARKELVALLGFLVVLGPLTYLIVKEELRQRHSVRRIHENDLEIQDALQEPEHRRTKRTVDIRLTVAKSKELIARLKQSRYIEKVLRNRLKELQIKLDKCVKSNVRTKEDDMTPVAGPKSTLPKNKAHHKTSLVNKPKDVDDYKSTLTKDVGDRKHTVQKDVTDPKSTLPKDVDDYKSTLTKDVGDRKHTVQKDVTDPKSTLPKDVSNHKSTLPTIFIVTPTYKRFVQKSELTRLKQAFQGVTNIHWIIVEDSPHRTNLVRSLLKDSGLPYTHLNVRTPSILRKHRGEARRFKPRGVFQRNLGIDWIRKNIDPYVTQGVVYFADDDNTYDKKIFDEMRFIKHVGVWPVAFTGAARWAGPICRNGKVIKWHTNWGHFRPFPIDMAGFAINIKVLIVDYPKAKFKAKKKPGLLESSLLKQITSKSRLEPIADGCSKVYVWHTRSQQPKDSILGERDLIRDGRPSNPSIET